MLEQEDEADGENREDDLTESSEGERDLVSSSISSGIDPSPLPSSYEISEEGELAWDSGSEFVDSSGRIFTSIHGTSSESCGPISGSSSIDETGERVGHTCASEGGDRGWKKDRCGLFDPQEV